MSHPTLRRCWTTFPKRHNTAASTFLRTCDTWKKRESLTKRTFLRLLTRNVVERAGRGMNVDAAVLNQWVTSICEEQINADGTSVYNIAALCLNDLESRQQLLACSSAAEALDELKTHVFGLVNEEPQAAR